MQLLDIVLNDKNVKVVQSNDAGVHVELCDREIARALSRLLSTNSENIGGLSQLF